MASGRSRTRLLASSCAEKSIWPETSSKVRAPLGRWRGRPTVSPVLFSARLPCCEDSNKRPLSPLSLVSPANPRRPGCRAGMACVSNPMFSNCTSSRSRSMCSAAESWGASVMSPFHCRRSGPIWPSSGGSGIIRPTSAESAWAETARVSRAKSSSVRVRVRSSSVSCPRSGLDSESSSQESCA